MKLPFAFLSDLWRLPGWLPQMAMIRSSRLRGQVRLLALAGLVGIVAGVGAIVFYVATRAVEYYVLGAVAGYYPEPRPGGEPVMAWLSAENTPLRLWLLVVVPTVGGLLSGVLVFTVAPEAEGHGTDSVIAAYHYHQGQIRPRVPLVKIIASALTLGSGGSGGREGPIAQIGAGFGSVLGNLLRLRPAERRVLMAAGMGSGIGAIFRAPLAGTIFAAEVLYRSPEFEPEVIIPTGIASVISYCIFGAYSGWEPLFTIPDLKFTNPWQLGPYLLLAIFMALLAMLYTRTFYGCKRIFDRLLVPRHFRPAIGALGTGLVAVGLYGLASCLPLGPAGHGAAGHPQQVLAVLAFGYSALQDAVMQDTSAAASILMMIALGKIVTTGLTIGSGGSGGVFGPSMVIGGCGGGALGILFHRLWPHLVLHPASFAIVGMAGFFAAAAKTPFSTLIIVSELTGGYTLLLPSLWVCTLSFILSDKESIYDSQVESRSRSPAHQGSYVRQVLADVHVSMFLSSGAELPTLNPDEPLAAVIDRLSKVESSVLPVVDGDGRLLGVVNLEEVHVAAQAPTLSRWVLAADLMRTDISPLTPDHTLDRALELFVENDLLALPVVSDLESRKVIGIVRRFDISNAYLRHVHGPSVPHPKGLL
jgi:chloride channel protein, CIC family